MFNSGTRNSMLSDYFKKVLALCCYFRSGFKMHALKDRIKLITPDMLRSMFKVWLIPSGNGRNEWQRFRGRKH